MGTVDVHDKQTHGTRLLAGYNAGWHYAQLSQLFIDWLSGTEALLSTKAKAMLLYALLSSTAVDVQQILRMQQVLTSM